VPVARATRNRQKFFGSFFQKKLPSFTLNSAQNQIPALHRPIPHCPERSIILGITATDAAIRID
jgi:hypothetical protein